MNIKKATITLFLFSFLLLLFKGPITSKFTSLFSKKPVFLLADQRYANQASSQTGEFDETAKFAYFKNKKIPVPKDDLLASNYQDILGLTAYASGGEKWIEVDLTNQRIIAHEGDQIVYNFPISSGLPWTPTVTGTYHIWIKLRFTRMAGGWEIGDPYDLPNVPFTMYFYKGYAIHGAYWHNDFGRPKSHGCVNMAIPDAEKLYYWANPSASPDVHSIRATPENPGTKVVVHGQAHL